MAKIPVLGNLTHMSYIRTVADLINDTKNQMFDFSKHYNQGPTGRGFQLRDGSGSGIGKNISGRIGYGLGTGIFIIYLINRVLSGSANLDRVFFGYFPTSYLSHGN